MRLRLIGGRVGSDQLRALVEVAERFGDGRVHVTSRANLQVRAFPGEGSDLDAAALAALESTGLVPTHTHELVRNVMTSPQTGLAGGRADLRQLGADLDALLCASDRLADLPGKFLFVLDDGRGDLLERPCDLGLVALDETVAQVRVAESWGPTVPLRAAASRLAALADRFLAVRGRATSAPWHVAELDLPLIHPVDPDPRLPAPIGPLAYGEVPGGQHVPVPDEGLDRDAVARLTAYADQVVLTPWRGVLVPGALVPGVRAEESR